MNVGPYGRDIDSVDFSSGWPNVRLIDTGYFDKPVFKSEQEVKAIFTVENMNDVYSKHDYAQPELDAMAVYMNRHRIHFKK